MTFGICQRRRDRTPECCQWLLEGTRSTAPDSLRTNYAYLKKDVVPLPDKIIEDYEIAIYNAIKNALSPNVHKQVGDVHCILPSKLISKVALPHAPQTYVCTSRDVCMYVSGA